MSILQTRPEMFHRMHSRTGPLLAKYDVQNCFRFVPCYWNDGECHDAVELIARSGVEIPIWLAGHHKNAGSWFKNVGYTRPSRSFLSDPAFLIFFAGIAMFLVRSYFTLKAKRKTVPKVE